MSVYATGYAVGTPTIGVVGAPALVGTRFGGVLSLTYPNGAPVDLIVTQVELRLCSGSTCVTVLATLSRTGPGTYAYSFTIPSLTGTVIIFLPAGSLTDQYGRPFPSVDTQIGTYTAPSSSTSQSLPAAGSPEQSSPQLMRQAVPQEVQVNQESTNSEIIVALAVLTLSTMGLVVLPSRRP
jgi:hypothetical protein